MMRSITDEAMGIEARHPILLAIAASGTIILASLLNFLRFNGYPLIAPEVGLVVLGLLAIIVPVGLLHARERPLGKALLEMLLVFLVLDQNGAGAGWAGAAAVLVGGIVIVRKRSALPFLGAAAVVTIVIGLLGIGDRHQPPLMSEPAPATPSASIGPPPPALLHVILDEHIGIAGLPTDNPRTPQLAAQLRSFYRSRGFRIYSRAYSDHLHTVNAIPQILNFGATQPPAATPSDGRPVKRNAYFDALARRGYRIIVHESDFLDFCGHPAVTRCDRYSSASLAPLVAASLSVRDKARLIAVRFAILSPTIDKIGKLYRALVIVLGRRDIVLPDLDLPLGGATSSLNALTAFDTLIADLHHAAPGQAYFAHILLPHYPYALDSNCRVRPVDDWMLRRSAASLRQRQDADLDQIRCATRELSRALDALGASPVGSDAIVIIHGDHGSRIIQIEPIIENADRLDRPDLIAGFTTLLAIRAPAVTPGDVMAPMPVSEALGKLTASGFTAAPLRSDREHPSVVLDDTDWRPRKRVAFPARW